MVQLLDEIHPGEILLDEFMKPMGITALRLGLYSGTDARFWMNLQTEYDLHVVTRDLMDKIAPRIRGA
jgi:plasmid maintenance system antidote protein VapI